MLDYIKNNNNDDDKKTYISEISGENKHIKNKRFHNSIKSDLNSKSIFNKETNEKLDLNQHKNPNKYAADYLEKKIKEVQEEVKIKKLEINLIYFYEDNDNSSENYNFSNDLKLRVLGGFFCVANVDVFEDLLTKIENVCSFILISTGSSFHKIDNLCEKFNCIKNIIIYCWNVKSNEFKKNNYISKEKIILISNDIEEVEESLYNSQFPDYYKYEKKLINHNPLISLEDYKKYYYIYDKILLYFFKSDYSKLEFCEGYKEKILEFIESNKEEFNQEEKNKLIENINKLKNSNNFLEQSLDFYTSENFYFFNKAMRKIDSDTAKILFLIGPMYYNIFRFIICFPSFTSTSFLKYDFMTTVNALKVNNLEKDNIILTMIIKYIHNTNKEIPFAMILGKYSEHKEFEVLLLPFTFVKFDQLKKIDCISYELRCEINDDILENNMLLLKNY